MRLRFSRHAKNNMRLYKIGEDDIEEVLDAPDYIYEEGGRKVFIKKVRKFTDPLKVVTAMKADESVVVTVYPFSKAYWRKK